MPRPRWSRGDLRLRSIAIAVHGGPVVGGHACGLTEAGDAYCWGAFLEDDRAFSTVPVRIGGGIEFESIGVAGSSGGRPISCGLGTDGTIYCWGSSRYRRPFRDCSVATCFDPEPVAVTHGLDFKDLAVATGGACGLTRDGLVYCWGCPMAERSMVCAGEDLWEPTLIPGQE